jgi:hypothetical protein
MFPINELIHGYRQSEKWKKSDSCSSTFMMKVLFYIEEVFFKQKSEWTKFDEGIHFIIHPQRIINAVE